MHTTTTRFEWLVGKERAQSLKEKTILLFGCGGVGSFAMESLVRSGLGKIIIVDGDVVDITNLNRQLVATHDTVGMRKVDAARRRCQEINQDTLVETHDIIYTREAYPDFFEGLAVDYVIDAVDMVTAKLDIIEEAKKRGIPVISSMGMGNKLDPTKITIEDISKTNTCPLARVVRRELKKRHIKGVPVAYSTEEALVPQRDEDVRSPGSCGFVPSVAGLAITSYVIRDLLKMLTPGGKK